MTSNSPTKPKDRKHSRIQTCKHAQIHSYTNSYVEHRIHRSQIDITIENEESDHNQHESRMLRVRFHWIMQIKDSSKPITLNFQIIKKRVHQSYSWTIGREGWEFTCRSCLLSLKETEKEGERLSIRVSGEGEGERGRERWGRNYRSWRKSKISLYIRYDVRRNIGLALVLEPHVPKSHLTTILLLTKPFYVNATLLSLTIYENIQSHRFPQVISQC